MTLVSRKLLLALAISGIGFAHADYARADYEDGVNAAQAGDYATALAEFEEAAEAGLDLAQFNLAILYYTGRGVVQSYEQALRWTLAAAEQGHLNAQNNLGALYYTGTGTEVNFEEALRWYEAAAIGQQPEAQYNLSTMYEAGEGTERDLVKAHFWALASQYNEYPEATELVNRQVKKMSAEQLSDARRTFAQWTLE